MLRITTKELREHLIWGLVQLAFEWVLHLAFDSTVLVIWWLQSEFSNFISLVPCQRQECIVIWTKVGVMINN